MEDTELNKMVEQFFQLPIEKINYDEIYNRFYKQEVNEYGNLLHAAVQRKFDEEKVLKFIKLLLENGYYVNYKGKRTGYNFIQLALYGYTDINDDDHSYSQEFILKLINIAKEHNLDVNTKDNDGDSIIHTAIASEVYEGEILPLLDALGQDFDINCRDNLEHNLTEAFDLYIEEAENTNIKWFNRLKKEEHKLKSRLSLGNQVLTNAVKQGETPKDELEKIKEQEEAITKELEKVMNNINIEYLIQNKDNIFSLKKELNIILNKKSLLTNSENEFENIWKKVNKLIEKVFSIEINKLKQQNNIDKLTELKSILEEYNYTEEQELINRIVEERKKIDEINNKIINGLTLGMKQDFINEISKLNNDDQEFLLNLLESYENELLSLITEINQQIKLLKGIAITINEVDYNQLTKVELKEVLEQNKNLILNKKQEILNEKQIKLESCIQEILDLETTGIFESDELWNAIKTSTRKRNKVKKK